MPLDLRGQGFRHPQGSDKPLVGTSGTAMLVMGGVAGRPGTERDVFAGGYRIDAENFVADLASRGVRSSIVRLAPTVHSSLDHYSPRSRPLQPQIL